MVVKWYFLIGMEIWQHVAGFFLHILWPMHPSTIITILYDGTRQNLAAEMRILSSYHSIGYGYFLYRVSLVAQRLKRLPGMQETQVRSWVRKIPWRSCLWYQFISRLQTELYLLYVCLPFLYLTPLQGISSWWINSHNRQDKPSKYV